MNVNIGGGASWNYPGWINLDQRAGVKLTPETVFHVEPAEFVYSSHCLEHLDDATVDRVLAESRRICKGKLVIKLPDFEEVLRRLRAGDEAYFDGWGMGKVYATWANRSIPVDINSKASMIFCGWWNDAYGDEWGARRPNAPGAYHGPVLPQLPESGSPHEMASIIRRCAPHGGHFNHQNAWSRDELKALLERHGFAVESMDAAEACKLPIPTIEGLRAISMYAVAA